MNQEALLQQFNQEMTELNEVLANMDGNIHMDDKNPLMIASLCIRNAKEIMKRLRRE